MAKSARKTARKTRKQRKQRGGAYQLGAALAPGLINNYGQVVVPLVDSLTPKSDTLGYTGSKGLPGMSGGRRRSARRSARGSAIRKQKGGTWAALAQPLRQLVPQQARPLAPPPPPMIPPVTLQCTSQFPSPDGQRPPTNGPSFAFSLTPRAADAPVAVPVAVPVAAPVAVPVAAPVAVPVAAPVDVDAPVNGEYNQTGGRYGFVSAEGAPVSGSPFTGGLAPMSRIGCESAAKQAGGAPVLQVPTAGYGSAASSWVGSTGAPSLIQTPYNAKAMNPACLKTGGARSHKRKGRKTGSRKA